MNQQTQPLNNFATLQQQTMRQFGNPQPGYISPAVNNFADSSGYNHSQVNALQQQQVSQMQQQQVNQILRGNSQDVGSPGEFYLHDPPPPHSQRRNWATPEQPRNHWNSNRFVVY